VHVEALLFGRAVAALEAEQAAVDHRSQCERCTTSDELCYGYLELHRDALTMRRSVLGALERALVT
jgi:hypothetical protein